MDETRIVFLKVRRIPELHRMFTDAVRTHFTYFPDVEQNRVIYNHRPIKLLLARLNPRRVVLIAEHNGEIVGYAIGVVPRDGQGQLFWLYVDPSRRGSNTGLSLLSRMLKVQRELGAREVSLATHDHRRYYERQGFIWRDTRDVDGVMMDIMTFPLGAA